MKPERKELLDAELGNASTFNYVVFDRVWDVRDAYIDIDDLVEEIKVPIPGPNWQGPKYLSDGSSEEHPKLLMRFLDEHCTLRSEAGVSWAMQEARQDAVQLGRPLAQHVSLTKRGGEEVTQGSMGKNEKEEEVRSEEAGAAVQRGLASSEFRRAEDVELVARVEGYDKVLRQYFNQTG